MHDARCGERNAACLDSLGDRASHPFSPFRAAVACAPDRVCARFVPRRVHSPVAGRRANDPAGTIAAMRAVRTLALAALAAAGFALTALCVRTVVPWPAEYGLAAKIRWFDEHADEYDLVFIGSSRVFRAFDPRLFDQQLAERGVHLRSFNFGVRGAQPFEFDRILRTIVERRPKRLRWVLYESGVLDPRFEEKNKESSRVVGWHTPVETLAALGSVRCAALEPRERLELAAYHVKLGLWNASNYGQGSAILGAWLGRDLVDSRGPSMTPGEIERGRGYVSFEEDPDDESSQRYRYLRANQAAYWERIEQMRRENEVLPAVDTLNLPVIREQRALVRSLGAEWIVVVLPQRTATVDGRALALAGELETLFDFNRPELHPELFAIESRYDPGHLSRAGAVCFSTLLAERFAAHLEKGSKQ